MDKGKQILGKINHFDKYARWLEDKERRETWDENVDRVQNMHIKRFPFIERYIKDAFNSVREKKVVPSMRSMQYAGKPIELAPNRQYNCAYMPINDRRAFREVMYLLIGGTGLGYSVQHRHTDQLPALVQPGKPQRYLIQDDQIGWSNAVDALIRAYTEGKPHPRFDYRDIRPKGTPLKTSGGRAPGPAPLKKALKNVEKVLKGAVGRKMRPIEVHDICCHIADCVVAGGSRRSAMIALFDADDEEMLRCKTGNWAEENLHRGRANNSAVIHYKDPKAAIKFDRVWEIMSGEGWGEPGVYWTYDYDLGTNPCVETSLNPLTFCNLTEINGDTVESKEDFIERCRMASGIGTIQAAYTDFHYLRPEWRENTEEHALIGVSITGIASGNIKDEWLEEGARAVKNVNETLATILDINTSARCTVVKPSGNTSTTLGTSSGIHDWHGEYYIRRITLEKGNALDVFLREYHPEIIVDKDDDPRKSLVEVPLKAPEGAITREDTTAKDLFERVLTYNRKWVNPGHRRGANRHNVSATISVRDHEYDELKDLVWRNRCEYHGCSFMPHSGGSYNQTPFEEITKAEYEARVSELESIDLSLITEVSDNTDRQGEIACAGGSCEI